MLMETNSSLVTDGTPVPYVRPSVAARLLGVTTAMVYSMVKHGQLEKRQQDRTIYVDYSGVLKERQIRIEKQVETLRDMGVNVTYEVEPLETETISFV